MLICLKERIVTQLFSTHSDNLNVSVLSLQLNKRLKLRLIFVRGDYPLVFIGHLITHALMDSVAILDGGF